MNRKWGKDGALLELAELFDLPLDAVAHLPHIELLGDRELMLSRHRGILSYSAEEITVATESFRLVIGGTGLTLCAMTAEELRIAGRIAAVSIQK